MKKGLLFVFLFSVFYSGFSQGTWVMKNTFPGLPRIEAVAFTIGNKGYLGAGNGTSSLLDDFWEYDPATDSWTQKANVPGAREYAIGFSIGNKGYIGTGNLGYQGDFYEYDPVLNKWTTKANLIGRATACCFAINGFGYVGTGGNPSPLDDLWKYDPIADTWTQMSNFPPGGRIDIDRASFVIGNKGYWGLGTTGSAYQNDFWEYDALTNAWTQRANFPGGGRVGATGFSLCDKGFLGLGNAPGGVSKADFWMYDPVTDIWSAIASFPAAARLDAPAMIVGNKAYVGTGYNGTRFNDWAEFTFICAAKPTAVFVSSDTTFCNESGSCIDFFDQSTDNPTGWKWFFPGAVPDTSSQQNPTNICYSTPGTYPVKLIVTNSTGSDSLTISPMITFATSAAAPVLTRSNDTIYCSNAAAYQWFLNGSPILNATDSFYEITGDGVYAVQITDDNGCTRLSDGFPVAVNEVSGAGGVRIYPNPAGNELWVVSYGFGVNSVRLSAHAEVRATIEINNVLGENVYRTQLTTQNPQPKTRIDISSLAKGIYFVEVSGGEKVWRAKIVKE